MKVQQHDGSILEMDKQSPEALEVLNHSTSHLLAEAIQELYPKALFGFGPAIENGFYYDIDFGDETITDEDFAKIEKKMHELAGKDEKIIRQQLPKEEALKLFKERNLPYFMGNKEARNALDGSADVLVCDGFTGNVFLKSSEGMAKWMGNMIKKAFKKNLWTKLGYLHVKKGINEISDTMDYKSTGGAMLLGVNSVVVKAHGNSDAFSFYNALRVAKAMVDAKVNDKIKEGLLANE